MSTVHFDILLIEDEEAIRDMIAFAMRNQPYSIRQSSNTTDALTMICETEPHLIIIDWMLPGQSGIEFVQSLKSNPSFTHIPVILLTAKAEESSKLRGFDAGIDDYITKPFSPKELMARIKALLKRSYDDPSEILRVGPVELNPTDCSVMVHGEVIDTGPLEYKLLKFLLNNPNQVFSREQLLDRVWGRDKEVTPRTVDVHIRRVRALLEHGEQQQMIKTIRLQGYMLSTGPSNAK